MPSYLKEVQRLKNPENINEAVFASSPYVLRKAFLADPTVQKLVRSGPAVLADIKQEMSAEASQLSDITLACFAHILSQVAPVEGAAFLAPELKKVADKSGPFFATFGTHLLRHAAQLPVRPIEMNYRREELKEVLGRY